MDETITQLGVGGILVVMVVRELVPVLMKRNGNGRVTRKEFETHKKSVQYKDNCSEIVKRLDSLLVGLNKQFDEVKDLIKDHK